MGAIKRAITDIKKVRDAKEKEEGIDLYVDMFNIQEAEFLMAKKLFKKYGVSFKDIEKQYKKGIMGIFNEEFTPYRVLFTVLISMIKHGDIK